MNVIPKSLGEQFDILLAILSQQSDYLKNLALSLKKESNRQLALSARNLQELERSRPSTSTKNLIKQQKSLQENIQRTIETLPFEPEHYTSFQKQLEPIHKQFLTTIYSLHDRLRKVRWDENIHEHYQQALAAFLSLSKNPPRTIPEMKERIEKATNTLLAFRKTVFKTH